MRDIRGDLKDRAEALDQEIKAAQNRFDELLVRLKQEHDARLNELKSELDAVKLLIGLEQRLLGIVTPQGNPAPRTDGTPQANGVRHGSAKPQGNAIAEAKPQAQAEAPRPQAQTQPPRLQQPDTALRKAG